EDGRRVTIAATVLDGRLATLDRLILSIRAGRTSLLVWQKKAYLVQGLLFDEYVYTGGRRRFEVKEIRLREPGSDETVTFKSGDDSPDEIEGLLLITVLEK
ncbi:MAG TPA: hypothetical protein VEB03_01800, partial [Candidatus Nanoarchaeia archaeon]|nr:hypothetical protein [Candidatus Nanoarchaeia archaeon]